MAEQAIAASTRKPRMVLKTWHWMILLPILAIAFKVANWMIAAGLDGRTVLHVHVSGEISAHTTPYSARLWAAMRGRTSLDYACPLNATPIEREWIIWPF